MPDQARPDSHDGVSRREILKRAAIAGGVAWAAPVIQSITTPAFAQVSPFCTGCFAVKVDDTGACEDQNGTTFCPRCTLPTAQTPGGCGCGFRVDMEPCDPETGTGPWTVTLPAGCTFHGGFSKCGGPQDQLCEPARDNGDGTVTFFPCQDPPGNPKCISHIEFCFCCT
jgi:hypothetical protein